MNESKLTPREEMSDLDWLARNEHSWPKDAIYVSRHENAVEWHYVELSFKGRGHFTKDQWLARRAELQNKPSWGDHHDAKCFVQRNDGKWFKNTETSSVHSTDSGEWMECMIHGGWVEICQGEVLGDWRDTLERRPTDMSEQAVIELPQEATENVLAAAPELMTEKYKFEPFVSVENAATAKQPEPKGSGNPILGMVLADLTNRALEGKEKYGEPLLAHNGRNPLWDAYQEALDLAMYLRQAIEEQK